MDEIIKEYLIESHEALDSVDRELVELEKDPTSTELLATVFRAIHTIKGNSGSLGYTKIESVAHAGESLLSHMRDGKLLLNATITSSLLAMTDLLRKMLTSIEETEGEGQAETGGVIASLQAILQDTASNNEAPQSAMAPETAVDGPSFDSAAEPLPVPAVEAVPQGLEAVPEQPAEGKKTPRGPESERGNGAAHSVTGSAIRVDVNLLDKVMNLVGELVLARNQVLQYTSTIGDATFQRTAQRLNLITTELQEGVMKTRMQPIGNVWNSFPRLVRDLSLGCGKLVRLEMEGAETELDKTIIEAIKDPLTHIVRNSIDHGMELPGIRKRQGKNPEGTISLHAYHEGGQVNIVIHDDGRGIDCEKVKQKALEKGLVSAQQIAAMPDHQVWELLFLPGLSTAQKVTNISGRGVGMDVVKTNIEKIGGTVDIQSAVGKGATIKIKIPLTLAIIPALMVMSGGERFAIPQVGLVELVRLEGEAAASGIESIYGAPVYRLRGNLLPLLSLNGELKLTTAQKQAGEVPVVNIVVLQADGKQFGLIVDAIHDTEEIVVKPLGKQLKGIRCFAGATILGDGCVALILDVPGLAQQAKLSREAQAQALLEKKKQETIAATGTESWLLFRVGEKGRLAIPLSAVSRLEEFDLSAIEVSDHRPVTQYRGGIMPIIFISDALHLPSVREDKERIQVVVYSEGGRDVGLAVDEILDIVDQHVVYNENAASSELLGSAVLKEHVTDLLNVRQIVAGRARSVDAGQESRTYVN
ncbi:MAG: chemotaxis protein CheA [Acidobacteriaceae bacterium]